MTTRLIVLLIVSSCFVPCLAGGLWPEEIWRPLPEKSLSGSTLPLRVNLLPPDVPNYWLDRPENKVLSPIARALADQDVREDQELRRKSEKRLELIVGSDRVQFKLRRNGIIMRARF